MRYQGHGAGSCHQVHPSLWERVPPLLWHWFWCAHWRLFLREKGFYFLRVGVLQAVSAQLSSAWQGVSPVERAGRHVGSKLTHKEDYDFYSGEIKEEKPLSGTVAVVSAVHSVCAC